MSKYWSEYNGFINCLCACCFRIFAYEKDLCDGLEICYSEWKEKNWLDDLRNDFVKMFPQGREL